MGKALFNQFSGEIYDEDMQLCQELLQKKYISPEDFGTLKQELEKNGKTQEEIRKIIEHRQLFNTLMNDF